MHEEELLCGQHRAHRLFADAHAFFPVLQWQLVNKPGMDDGPRLKYNDRGASPYLWNENLLGAQSSWQDAGRAALGLGVIAIIATGFALLFTLISVCKQDFSKAPASIMAFMAGFAFLLGAVIYEGVRPSWGGDMGYNVRAHCTWSDAWNACTTLGNGGG